jgi:hypothetical protein
MITRKILVAASLVALAPTLTTAAQAASRDGSVSVQGVHGRGFVASRQFDRTSSGMSASRQIQTNGGHGTSQSYSRTHADGVYTSSSQTSLNNGRSRSTDTVVQNNGDGTASYQHSISTSGGYSKTVSGTVPYRPR